ncbi:pseudouridine synthase [Candidatus Desulforudis audaxviator]|uniref:Pseudouridine synthase n=1 Tax=Desulforudis audaxviator (strain MP104C) TaxID=477974 RepID=B1I3X6_DESAP|nr:pseudouridine synthase [Candidatus Desulforudis audaxviator]ACA59707.1 pseudouridine synthase [Candidatus Desulforudis audaxviator MP104C]AZK59700.1 Ribosomal large subunit pseudouridine synthase B [Candidatus Desulforudis audaxviator]
MRLQKYLAEAGIASRRASEELILAGRVRVNGEVVRELGTTVDSSRDRVEVDGQKIRPEPKIYVLLYKPRGYVTTARDPQGRRKVTDLVAGAGGRVFPVGRLDYDSEGLLLLTNDGELAYRLTHPRFHVPKTYHVVLDRSPGPAALRAIARGVELDDGLTAPAGVRLVRRDGREALVEMTIHEGRKRQVRRMWAALGFEVQRLKRVRMAGLELGGLEPGRWRHLRTTEVRELRKLVRLP